MRNYGNRKILVNKEQLIKQIKENKATHIEEYEKAVVAYKQEALKQLSKLTEKANNGYLKLDLHLITPVNNSDNYDKIIEMFEWEVADEVELTQDEFKEYVQDENDFAIRAKMSNTAYFVS
jgi:hypothetical protein